MVQKFRKSVCNAYRTPYLQRLNSVAWLTADLQKKPAKAIAEVSSLEDLWKSRPNLEQSVENRPDKQKPKIL